MTEIVIDLQRLTEQSALSPFLLGTYREAAEVVLDLFHGAAGPPTAATIAETGRDISASIAWCAPSESARASHDNRIDASEFAACAVAIGTMHAHAGLRVVRRALHGSGSDFLMRRPDARGDDFERLEVSGITGSTSPATRLREKVDELRRGNDRRPGRAVVVAFPGRVVRVLIEEET